MVVEEILRLCFLGNLDARKPNTPLALGGVAAGCRPRSSNATAQERKHLSSADCLGGDTGSAGSLRVLCSPCFLFALRGLSSVGCAGVCFQLCVMSIMKCVLAGLTDNVS